MARLSIRRLVVPAAAAAVGIGLLIHGVVDLTGATTHSQGTTSSRTGASATALPPPIPVRKWEGAESGSAEAATASPGSRADMDGSRPGREPVLVEIPRLRITANVEGVSTSASGQLETPIDPARVGWWKGGHAPGSAGPAVLVGHRDSAHGPAVFYALGEIVLNDIIRVRDVDGHAWTFSVTNVQQVTKNSFPTQQVYGETDSQELRLLTCAGAFTDDEYEENLIVYAALDDGAR